MTTLLPKDADNNTIPALRLRDNGAHQITIGATATKNTAAFNDETKIISLYATSDTYVAFGDSTVIATTNDHFFPAGLYYDIAITAGNGKTAHNAYVSVLQVQESGTLYISEKE